MGHSNAGKGYGLLPDALALATAENEEALFKVHGFIDRRDKVQDRTPFEKLAALGPRVCFQGGVLPTGDYHALMVAADMLLLPYSPEVYRSRGSGIFNDGERLGKPAIAPRECSFASEAFAEGRAIPIDSMSARAVADAVSIALRDFKSLQSRATAYARQRKTDGLGPLIQSLLQAELGCRSAAIRQMQESLTMR
jgi:glycosyltransferase involved in cell wall biosynthesis